MSAPVKFVAGDTPLSAALAVMARDKISSLLVSNDARPALVADTAIVTERDMMRALAERGAGALDCRCQTSPAGRWSRCRPPLSSIARSAA